VGAKGAEQSAEQAAGKGQHAKGSSQRLALRSGLDQAQALKGRVALILLTADEGFEIRHSISLATV